MGDYKDKTVTLEDFPFFANAVKMASVHPCKHASVMKTLLDRADAALKLRRDKLKAGAKIGSSGGMEGLVDEINKLDVSKVTGDKGEGDEWEEVGHDFDDQEVAIRVDQYLVVFLKVSLIAADLYDDDIYAANLLQKFIASVTPGIEHDFTMGV